MNSSSEPTLIVGSSRPAGRGLGTGVCIGLLGLLAGVLMFVYWDGLNGGFAFDDFHNIVNNPYLQMRATTWREWLVAAFSGAAGPFQRPLAMLSFAANVSATGMDPWPMKLTNLIVHLLNTLLVFSVCRQIFRSLSTDSKPSETRNEYAALAAAACWTLNPINLTSVLYVVQRMESLCHTFVFAGMWCYLQGRRRQLEGGRGWPLILCGILGGTTLGALSKESALLLPVYAFCVETSLLRFQTFKNAGRSRSMSVFYLVVLIIPAVAAAAVLLPTTLSPGAYAMREFTLSERLMTEARVVLDYLQWTILPNLNQLGIYHDDYVISRGLLSPPATLLCILGISALLCLAWKLRKPRPITALGILWFFSAHLMTGTIIPLELVHEHRNYFASLGVCLVVVDTLLLSARSDFVRRAGPVATVVCILLYAGITFLRATEWNHPVRFAITEAAKHPNSPRATYDLARNLVGLSKYDPGSPFVVDAWPALERARDAPGSNILPNQAALILAARTGVRQDPIWWNDMQVKLRSQPLSASNLGALASLNDCAVEGLCVFEPSDMLSTFSAALRNRPDPTVLGMYGEYAWHVLQDRQLTLRLWQEALAMDPGNPRLRSNHALLLIDLGRFNDARVEISALRRLSRLGAYETVSSQLEAKIEVAQRVPDKARAAPEYQSPGG